MDAARPKPGLEPHRQSARQDLWRRYRPSRRRSHRLPIPPSRRQRPFTLSVATDGALIDPEARTARYLCTPDPPQKGTLREKTTAEPELRVPALKLAIRLLDSIEREPRLRPRALPRAAAVWPVAAGRYPRIRAPVTVES